MKTSSTTTLRSLRAISFVLSCCALSPKADAQLSYVRTYAVPLNWYPKGSDVTSDDGLILCGQAPWLIRLDNAGNVLWVRSYSGIGTGDSGTFGAPVDLVFQDVVSIGDSGCIVVGASELGGLSSPEKLMVRFDVAGNEVWAGSTGSLHYDSFFYTDKADLGYVLVGGVMGGLNTSYATLNRVDITDGAIIDQLAVSETWDQAVAIDRSENGGYVLASTNFQYAGSFITRADAALAALWTVGWSDHIARAVKGLPDGSVIVVCDSVVVRLLPNGQVDWSKALHVGDGRITDMQVRADGTILLTGWSDQLESYSWLVLLDQAGNVISTQRYGGAGDVFRVSRMEMIQANGLRLIGTAGTNEALLIATDSSGVMEPCMYPALSYSLTNIVLTPSGNPFVSSVMFTEPLDLVVTSGIPLYVPATNVCGEGSPFSASGKVFQDVDMDGTLDAGEPGLPYSALTVLPDNAYTFTDSAGEFNIHASTIGTYGLVHTSPDPWWQLTSGTSSYVVPFTANDSVFTGLDFGYAPAVDTSLLVASLAPNPTVCGGTTIVTIGALNNGSTTPEGIAALTLDTLISFFGSNPAPDSIVGSTYYWSFDSLGWFQLWQQTLTVVMPSASFIGDTIRSTLLLLEDDGTGVLTTADTATWQQVIVCSFDPNDKLVDPQGSGPYGAIPFDTEWLTYTIRFQNTGNDTATTVVIEDLLSTDLDHASLQVLGYSHPITGLSIGSGVLAIFRFDDIQLPDSNVNEIASHGFVKFRVRVLSGLPHLTEITNNAGIYFDLNPPVITNMVLNTIVDCAQADLHATVCDDGGGYLYVYTFFMDTVTYAYQWFLNGTAITGATMAVHTTEVSGDYSVLITDPYGCSLLSDPLPVIVTSIDAAGAVRITIAPNPFRDHSRITFSEAPGSDVRIELLDAQGRLLRSMKGNGSREMIIERGALGTGVYLLRVSRNGAQPGMMRLVAE